MTTPSKMIDDAFPERHLRDLPMYRLPPERASAILRSADYYPGPLLHEFEAPYGEAGFLFVNEEMGRFLEKTEQDAVAALGDLDPRTMMILVAQDLVMVADYAPEDDRELGPESLIPCKFQWDIGVITRPLPEEDPIGA